MKTVKEVSLLTGVSVRTLHYYDSIGLLHPTKLTQAGYRLYDDTALERLQYILLFRELQFSLKSIKQIIDSPNFNGKVALSQQIELLMLQKEHIQNLIDLASGIKTIGVKNLDFSAFDKTKINDYEKQAKSMWGNTTAYKEYEEKTQNMSTDVKGRLTENLADYFRKIGDLKVKNPSDVALQKTVAELRRFITDNYYECTPKIFRALGVMYSDGGSMTEYIDNLGGKGTAKIATEAINIYCDSLT